MKKKEMLERIKQLESEIIRLDSAFVNFIQSNPKHAEAAWLNFYEKHHSPSHKLRKGPGDGLHKGPGDGLHKGPGDGPPWGVT